MPIFISYFQNSFDYALEYIKALHADKLANIKEKVFIWLCCANVFPTKERNTNDLVGIFILSYYSRNPDIERICFVAFF